MTGARLARRRRPRLGLMAAALFFVLGSMPSTTRVSARADQPPAGQRPADAISASAMAQIEALLEEKQSRTPAQRKIDSQLLYEVKMARGEAIAAGVPTLDTGIDRETDSRIVVDVTAYVSDALLNRIRGLGGEVVSASAEYRSMRLRVLPDQIEAIAALPDVIFVQPKQEAMTSRWTGPPKGARRDAELRARRPRTPFDPAALAAQLRAAFEQSANVTVGPGQGTRISQGEYAHRAFTARGVFKTDGTGVKIGVLSDGVASLAASQAAGDLGTVTVLSGQAGEGDEGTAMLEIVHDLAPGAQLYFATGFSGISQFAANIRALRNAGCTIIVDDIGYFVETPFQDGQAASVVSTTNGGVVSEAVKDVTGTGVLYFSSAANSGNKSDGTSGTWEGDFVDGGAAGAPISGAGQLHNFGSQNFNVLTATGGTSPINLHWSDPLGGSGNDYDLYLLNSTGTVLVGASTNFQTGTQDPYEQILGSSKAVNQRIVIAKASGSARFLHLSTNRGTLSISTNGETHGHAAVTGSGAFGVAAVNASTVSPNPFTGTNVVEIFSSDGPRRVFYNNAGTALTPGNVSATGGQLLQKPDFAAADGVSVTGVGNFPRTFFGTSAAAPHAAAIAALLKSANASLTQAQVRTALTSTAIDIEAAGVDQDSGAGIIMAFQALQSLGLTSHAFLAPSTVTATEDPGNANGAINVGEGARLTVGLTNNGLATLTGISATLTTSTPGVTVQLPGTSAYADLAVGASGNNSTSFRFTVASTASCPLVIDFNLSYTFAGSTSPRVIPFQVTTGPPPFTITTTLDTSAPSASAGVTAATGTQTARLSRDGVSSGCSPAKVNPNTFLSEVLQFDSYAFSTCAENTGSCALVTFTGTTNGVRLNGGAFVPSFAPATPSTNYAGDAGYSISGTSIYGFPVPAGASKTAAVTINEVNANAGIGVQYTLTVAGLCARTCATPNQVPLAKAKNVTVTAGSGGTAAASIDNGSSDPDGDALTITQSPAGPYAIGTTTVTLTVVDTKGATSQATGNVTVITNPPAATITSPTSSPTLTTTASSIDLGGTASDDFAVTSVTWTNNRGGSGTASGTTTWTIAGIALQQGANVITVTATDAQSQTGTATLTVTVPPTMTLTPGTINFGVVNNGGTLSPATPPQTLTMTQGGPATITWTVSATQPWISVTPTSGSGGGTLTVTIVNPAAPNQLPPIGSGTGAITVNTSGAANSPGATVNLTILASPQATTPTGSFDTPADGQSNVTGSIAVTGWAIDDIGVTEVEIVRDPVAGEGASQVFIGNAVFVAGARPDIAALAPLNPLKDRAGWGYLLLTNFLPNQGNGTFRLSAYAKDVEGNRVLLGSRTITCTNASATAPFGAIDTPGQGATVSGSSINFGWALAGQPTGRFIPINGSTIQVFIDSVSTGTVESYNNARSDIQALFPGYANTNGAIGVKTINSSTLANGTHTIFWIVTDNLGAAAGIGSRFFSVSNSSVIAGATSAAQDVGPATSSVAQDFSRATSPVAQDFSPALSPNAVIDATPAASTDSVSVAAVDRADTPVMVRRGFDAGAASDVAPANADGVRHVRTAQLERIVVDVAPIDDAAVYRGYSIDGDTLRALPVGSHFDDKTGEFAWAPGLAFGGTHRLLFVRDATGRRTHVRVDVIVDAQPTASGEPRIAIDTPGAGALVHTPFTIAGWAIDPRGTGTGVDTLHVWAYPADGAAFAPGATGGASAPKADPIWVGGATIGGLRPDVAALFGARFASSGFTIDAGALPAGTYDIVVYAHSVAAGDFAIARSVRVTVR